MGSVSNFVQSTITSATRSPSQQGFGTPLIACTFTTPSGPKLVYEYNTATALDDMLDDGFLATEVPYKMVAVLVSQSPCPPTVKVGRRTHASTFRTFVNVSDSTEGLVLKLTVNGTVITYTVEASKTTTEVAAIIAALIDALEDVGCTNSGSNMVLTFSALPDISNWSKSLQIAGADIDTSVGLDLDDIQDEDSDWFGFSIDSATGEPIVEAAAWADSHAYKFFFGSTSDFSCTNGSTNDVMSTMKTASTLHAYIEYNGTSIRAWGGVAEMSTVLAQLPGSYTGAFKTHIGVPADTTRTLSAGQRSAIMGKNGNVYEAVAGLNVTSDGKVPFGEYLDVVIFRDWVNSQIQTRVFGAMANALKVPYTDTGTQVLASQVRAVMTDGINVGGFAANPAPTVVVAKVAAQSDADRAARRFPGITWSATLAGAIHFTRIGGTIGV